MKRLLAFAVALTMLLSITVCAEERPNVMYDTESGETEQTLAELMPVLADASALTVNAKSAILMDMTSGKVLFEQNAHEPLPVASVTKVMTLLLVMEAVDSGRLSLDDVVTTSARAASMGGSQIWLEENEKMTVDDLLKAAAVVSANDACAALAEHLCGTVEAFVTKMNERAKQLGAKNTDFVDCSGLSDEGYSSAYDIALISRELMMKHPSITKYTTVWMDSLRGGQSELVNTNRLIRFYNGATGLKTGTTSAAKYCLSATAQRDGLPLCAVVLGAASTDDRFGGARNMLDFGFANYTVYTPDTASVKIEPIPVRHGAQQEVAVEIPKTHGVVTEKGQAGAVKMRVDIASDLQAPVEQGQTVGEIVYYTDEGQDMARYALKAASNVEEMTLWRALCRFFAALTVGKPL